MRKLFALLVAAALLSFGCVPAPASDLSITAASVIPSSSAIVAHYTAGATITAGQLVYYDTTTSTVKLADANASAAASTIRGIAVNGASSGQSINVCTYDPELTLGGTLTVGDVLFCSATAGGIAPAADVSSGWYVTVVGVVVSSTKICFGVTMRSAAAKS